LPYNIDLDASIDGDKWYNVLAKVSHSNCREVYQILFALMV